MGILFKTIPKAIFYLLKGDYTCLMGSAGTARSTCPKRIIFAFYNILRSILWFVEASCDLY